MSRVAIQGIAGSYSEEAAFRILGTDTIIVECFDFKAVFEALRSGSADAAVIPVRNKIVGEIKSSVDLLRLSGLHMRQTLSLEVRHVLTGTPNAEFDDIRTVRSHVEAIKQCGKFFANNEQLRKIDGSDTAVSVREVIAENDRTQAAIGSRRAAELYGAKVLRENIADDPDNWTTFCLIGE